MFFLDSSVADYTLTSWELELGFKTYKWFDDVTAAAFKDAWDQTGTIIAQLNWYRANVFGSKNNIHFSNDTVQGAMRNYPNLTISVPTLVLWGLGDGAFDN